MLATEDPSQSLRIVGATPEVRSPAYYDKGVSSSLVCAAVGVVAVAVGQAGAGLLFSWLDAELWRSA